MLVIIIFFSPVQDRQKILQSRRSILPRVRCISVLTFLLCKLKTHLYRFKDDKKIVYESHELQDILAVRRRYLLYTLTSIYPIARPAHLKPPSLYHSQISSPTLTEHSRDYNKDKTINFYTIRGLKLPTTQLTAYDEEQISTALGYVAHFVLLLSKYLNIPLRYRIIYRGSRSTICDDTASYTQFPLYFKSVEDKRFELAFFFLNKNIEHVTTNNNNKYNPSPSTHVLFR